MLVSDVMTAFPAFIRLGASIRRAAEVISVSEVGRLMVLDRGITAGAAPGDDPIPPDKGIPGHGGPLPLSG